MTSFDRAGHHPGYWPSAWPVECGGNRRQKTAIGRLDAAAGTAHVTTVRNDKWNVMTIGRAPGQWYVGGTMAAFTGPPPFGWVDRIDVESLLPVASSPELPCGDHVWCGAILAHANGSIMSVNGSYLHALDPDDLSVLAERRLPAERSHNGLLALADGSLITKDLRLEGQGGTTITRVAADTFELIGEPLVLPEGSMGRIAADLADDGTERVYVPGTEHIWRLGVGGDRLTVDDSWRPRYRTADDRWGLSWDACLSNGACWIMDCGDVESVRGIHTTEPNGRFDTPPGSALSWRRPAPWPGAQRLLRLDLQEPDDVRAIEPFGTPGGGIIAPPVDVPEYGVAIAWDSINGGIAGIDTTGDELAVRWQLDARASMQPVVFAESGELVINDFTDDGRDDLIVVDVAGGDLLERVETGSRIANGMFLSAGGDRDVFYCTTTVLARVRWT
ncbi:hypothetical protein [Ilumatobacter sp.]|uniref:hypothetical protein n=1 Tax=Ilumatobacter sp. TaxID=1967498 RepID=UPI003AF65365